MVVAAAWTALVMGLVGGPHCLAMCAAPCAAVTGAAASVEDQAAARVVHWHAPPSRRRTIAFHLGRMLGYALAGGLAALAVDRLAWLTQHTAALRPAWTLMHLVVLAWSVLMMAQARQPAWVERAGRTLWALARPWVARPGSALSAGVAWAMMPCGLLYSALLVAALSGSVWSGATVMASFAAGGAAWLAVGPWAWARLRSQLNLSRDGWGTRLAGLVLFASTSWAIWLDFTRHASPLWCT